MNAKNNARHCPNSEGLKTTDGRGYETLQGCDGSPFFSNMKIILKFNHNDSDTYPCACLAYREGEKFAVASSVSKTWAEAEAEALQKAKAMLNVGDPPQPKELTI